MDEGELARLQQQHQSSLRAQEAQRQQELKRAAEARDLLAPRASHEDSQRPSSGAPSFPHRTATAAVLGPRKTDSTVDRGAGAGAQEEAQDQDQDQDRQGGSLLKANTGSVVSKVIESGSRVGTEPKPRPQVDSIKSILYEDNKDNAAADADSQRRANASKMGVVTESVVSKELDKEVTPEEKKAERGPTPQNSGK